MPLELDAMSRATRLRRPDESRARTGVGSARRGRVGSFDVVALATGMGTDRARRTTERLLSGVEVDRVVVVGIAGGVDASVAIGTVVDPEVVIDAASGERFVPDSTVGACPAGALWTTDVMTGPDELPGLRAAGVVALDMETAAIAAVCRERGVPWSVVRAISDDPSDEVDDEVFAMSNADGTPNPRRVVSYVVRHPHRIGRLARLGRHAQLAARNAATAAVDHVQSR